MELKEKTMAAKARVAAAQLKKEARQMFVHHVVDEVSTELSIEDREKLIKRILMLPRNHSFGNAFLKLCSQRSFDADCYIAGWHSLLENTDEKQFNVIKEDLRFKAWMKEQAQHMFMDKNNDRTTPAHYSIIVVSIAKLGMMEGETAGILEEVQMKGRWLVEAGNTIEVADTARGFATLGVRAKSFFVALEKRSEWLVDEGEPKDLANVTWSYSELKMNVPSFKKAMQGKMAGLSDGGQSELLRAMMSSTDEVEEEGGEER